MKMKNLLLTIAATFGMTALIMAQNVPNYVPTNGLVGWWPFNGNANDESGSANNGTVNGATLTNDRFNITDKAYSFDGSNSEILFNSNFIFHQNTDATISFWFKKNQCPNFTNGHYQGTLIWSSISNIDMNRFNFYFRENPNNNFTVDYKEPIQNTHDIVTTTNIFDSIWTNVVISRQLDDYKLFINGNLIDSTIDINPSLPNSIGYLIGNDPSSNSDFAGSFDDLGIWNRALTQQEITALYTAVNCANNTIITPPTNTLNTGNTATFAASTSDPNPSYVWQSDLGQGFQTLNNFGNYSGANTGTLNIANVQLPNHTQPIRVITTSGNCVDTSIVAIISITDTCINTVTDTTFIAVTDTLVINTTITSLNPPNNANTIKVFPNPTNDHITIDYGNFSVMNGYQLKIENSLGQQVFLTNITQQSDYLNLTTWGGNGLYFVHIIDTQGNTIDIRKIVLQ